MARSTEPRLLKLEVLRENAVSVKTGRHSFTFTVIKAAALNTTTVLFI
jgi:hypothetical protein